MNRYRITMNGKTYEMDIELISSDVSQTVERAEKEPDPKVEKEKTAAASKAIPTPAQAGSAVTSPMPGTILRVNASEGQRVQAGETVLVLEAMKMENEIQAPVSGTVSLAVSEGQTVATGEALFSIG